MYHRRELVQLHMQRRFLPGPSGVRAQVLAPDGTLLDDFIVDGQ